MLWEGDECGLLKIEVNPRMAHKLAPIRGILWKKQMLARVMRKP